MNTVLFICYTNKKTAAPNIMKQRHKFGIILQVHFYDCQFSASPYNLQLINSFG